MMAKMRRSAEFLIELPVAEVQASCSHYRHFYIMRKFAFDPLSRAQCL